MPLTGPSQVSQRLTEPHSASQRLTGLTEPPIALPSPSHRPHGVAERHERKLWYKRIITYGRYILDMSSIHVDDSAGTVSITLQDPDVVGFLSFYGSPYMHGLIVNDLVSYFKARQHSFSEGTGFSATAVTWVAPVVVGGPGVGGAPGGAPDVGGAPGGAPAVGGAPSRKTLPCAECEISCTSQSGLNRHIIAKHPTSTKGEQLIAFQKLKRECAAPKWVSLSPSVSDAGASVD